MSARPVAPTLTKLYGERNTGTNYLARLLGKNFQLRLLHHGEPSLMYRHLRDDGWLTNLYFHLSFPYNLGWKHGLVDPVALARRSSHPLERVLFVTLTKNPYAWLLSLYKRPYHAKARWDSLEDFLRAPWPTLPREGGPPCYPTPMHLWNAKNRAYLALAAHPRASAVAHVRYEDLLADPLGLLAGLQQAHGLQPKGALSNVLSSTKQEALDYDGYRDYYLSERWREKLSDAALALISEHLDDEVMGAFGYDKLAGQRVQPPTGVRRRSRARVLAPTKPAPHQPPVLRR